MFANPTTTATTHSFSFFAKQNTRQYISIVTSDTVYWQSQVVVDLTDGSITKEYTKSYQLTNKVENFGNGWYKISSSIEGAFAGNTFYSRIYLSDVASPSNPPSNTYTGTGLSAYIWGAQFEEQHQATTYLPSYGIASVRKATTTNTLTYSEDFSQWTIDGNASITSNAITSPIGTSNATKLIAGSSSGRQAIKLNDLTTGNLTLSVFAKKGEYSVIQLTDARSGTAFINFDLQNGLVGSSEVMIGKIENLGNDWYRCSATYNSSNDILAFRLSIAESSTSTRLQNFAGNGSNGLYIWGGQVELQTQVETYAKTTGLPVTIDLFTENNYGTMINMTAGDIVPDTPNN